MPQAPQDPIDELRREMLNARRKWTVLSAILNQELSASLVVPLTPQDLQQVRDFRDRLQPLNDRVTRLPHNEYWSEITAFNAACGSFEIALGNIIAGGASPLSATDVQELNRTYSDLNQTLAAFEPQPSQTPAPQRLPVPPSPQPNPQRGGGNQQTQPNLNQQQNQAPTPPNLQAAVQAMKEANYDLVVNDAKKHKGVIDKAELKENDSFLGGIKARMKLVGEWFATTAVGRLAGGLAASQVVAYGAAGVLGTVGSVAAAPIVAGVLGAIAAGMTIRQMTKGFRTRQQAIVDMRHLNKRNEKAALKGQDFSAASELDVMSRNRKRRSLVFAAASLGMAGWHAADPNSFTHAMSSVYDHTLRGPVEFIDAHTQGTQSDIHEWFTGMTLPHSPHLPDNDIYLQDVWYGQAEDLDRLQFELGQLEGLKLPLGVEMRVWDIHNLLDQADVIHTHGLGLHGDSLGLNDSQVGGMIGRADGMLHSLHAQIGHDIDVRIDTMGDTVDEELPPWVFNNPEAAELADHMRASFDRAHEALTAGDYHEAIVAYGDGKHQFDMLMNNFSGIDEPPFAGMPYAPAEVIFMPPHEDSFASFHGQLTAGQLALFNTGQMTVSYDGPMDHFGSDGLAGDLLRDGGIIDKAAAALGIELDPAMYNDPSARHALAMILQNTPVGHGVLAHSHFHPGEHIDMKGLFSNLNIMSQNATHYPTNLTDYFGGHENFMRTMQLIHDSFSR